MVQSGLKKTGNLYIVKEFFLKFPLFLCSSNKDSPNVPCSAERSAECSVIFGQFLVLLFNGGTGKVKRNPYFQHFLTFFRTVLLLFYWLGEFTDSIDYYIFMSLGNPPFSQALKGNLQTSIVYYMTPLASSADVERLFSTAGHIYSDELGKIIIFERKFEVFRFQILNK